MTDNHLIHDVDILLGKVIEAIGDNIRRLRIVRIQLVTHYPVSWQLVQRAVLFGNAGILFRIVGQLSFDHQRSFGSCSDLEERSIIAANHRIQHNPAAYRYLGAAFVVDFVADIDVS
ncbi:hypothetical protein D3C76_257500 [compost metagenome]